MAVFTWTEQNQFSFGNILFIDWHYNFCLLEVCASKRLHNWVGYDQNMSVHVNAAHVLKAYRAYIQRGQGRVYPGIHGRSRVHS